MCNKDLLIGYLYDELSPAERGAFEEHAATCEACRQEIRGLRQARQHLSSWSPPEPALDFHIIRGPVEAPRRRVPFVPQWALAAAATIVLLAGAAAIAHVEVRYGPDGLVVRTGWGSTIMPPAPVEPAPAVAATAASEQLKGEVVTLQQRIQQMEEAQTKQVSPTVASIRPGITASELRKILAESEARQRTELAVKVAQIWNDFNAARASDLLRVQQALDRTQHANEFRFAQTRGSLDQLRSVVQPR